MYIAYLLASKLTSVVDTKPALHMHWGVTAERLTWELCLGLS